MDLVGGLARRVRDAAPVPYAAPNRGAFSGLFSRSGKERELAAYGSVGTLFAVVSAISEATAAQEWWLERVQRNSVRKYGPDQPRRTQVLQHPALDLWNRPNPYMSRHELVEVWTQHLKLAGESYGVLVSDPRFPALPLEMWPVRPDRMTPVPSSTDFLAGWVYSGPEGEKIPLDPEQVIQVKLPNPLDPYRGMSPVQALLADLDAARFSAEWNRRFFLNDASPGGVIEVDGEMSDREFQKAKDRWYDQHRGIGNAHRVAFLTKMKWVPVSFSPRDMQFVQLRKYSSDAIREAYRVHPAILGQSADVNRANAEAADFQLAQWNVDPTLSRFAGALNTRLLPRYADPVTVEFHYESAVPEDQAGCDAHLTAQVSAYAALVNSGVSPDDAALTVGLPPMRTTTPAVEPAPTLEAIPA